MGDGQTGLAMLVQAGLPRLALVAALASGVLLTYFGVRFFATLLNAALFAAGALLAAIRAVGIMQQPAPPAMLQSALPLGIWGAAVFLNILDRKFDLTDELTFPAGLLATGLLALIAWLVLLPAAGRSLTSDQWLYLAIGSLVLVFVAALLLVRLQASKPLLIVACTLFGSVVLGYMLWSAPALFGALGPTGAPSSGGSSAAAPLPGQAAGLASLCLRDPSSCSDAVRTASSTAAALLPRLLLWLLVPLTGLLAQAAILLHFKRTRTVDRLGSLF